MTRRVAIVLLLSVCATAAAVSSDVLTLSDTQMLENNVRTARIEPSPKQQVTAPGTTEFDKDLTALVGPRLPGSVIAIVRHLGDHVAAGDVIAKLDSVELGNTRARCQATQAEYGAARAVAAREDSLAAQQISSEADRQAARAHLASVAAERQACLEELKLYGANDRQSASADGSKAPLYAEYRLYSPIEGIVEDMDLEVGQTIAAHATPIRVVNTERMWLIVNAAEADVARLRVGQIVDFVAAALPGDVFDGHIDWIAASLDPATRTLRVRATLANPQHLLKAGMSGNAKISVEQSSSSVWIPVDAVQTLQGASVVFVPESAHNTFRAVVVRTGEQSGGRIEIVKGLRNGQSVVTSGGFALASILSAAATPQDAD